MAAKATFALKAAVNFSFGITQNLFSAKIINSLQCCPNFGEYYNTVMSLLLLPS
jgi:hypothetical protein